VLLPLLLLQLLTKPNRWQMAAELAAAAELRVGWRNFAPRNFDSRRVGLTVVGAAELLRVRQANRRE